ncbi:MAG: tRNA pseudouridine(38-40) synthase TruA [Dehalococcoidales bacterium]
MATSTKIVLIMEYDGTHYYGFQLQANLPTIQGEIEKALWKLTGENSRVMAASRTDTGVHAKEQVASFRTKSSLPSPVFIKGLNYYLPKDIAIIASFRVSDSFNVRRSAISREYNYYILNSQNRSPIRRGFSYHVTGHLDIEAMNQACQILIGKHDFASFATSMESRIKNTLREIYRAKIEKEEDDLLVFNIVANSFLPHQVRNTAGALIKVGLGKMTVDEFRSILEARRHGLAGPTAPAYGLCLMRVNYPHTWEEVSN